MTRVNGNPGVSEGVVDIRWAADGKRIRKVVKRSGRKITGKHPSWKMDRMVHYESEHELNAIHLHDADPAVTLIREQPARLRFVLNGEVRTHVPDFYVESEGKKIFREVKEVKEANRDEIRERTDLLKSILPIKGYEYDLITEEEIEVQPRLENAKQIARLGRNAVTMIDEEVIRREVSGVGYVMWGELEDDCFGEYSIHKACRLILEGKLRIDMNMEITGDTQVWVDGLKNGDECHG